MHYEKLLAGCEKMKQKMPLYHKTTNCAKSLCSNSVKSLDLLNDIYAAANGNMNIVHNILLCSKARGIYGDNIYNSLMEFSKWDESQLLNEIKEQNFAPIINHLLNGAKK
jgi:hypothetical protein